MLYGCGNGADAPDVSEIKAEVRSTRFDMDLAAVDTANMPIGLQQLKQKYPDFLDFYLDTLMGLGINGAYTNDNPGVQMGLRSYLTHKDFRGVFDTVKKYYPDTKDIDAQLEKGFKYTKHYFEGYQEPKVIYLVSFLGNWAALTYGNTLGIGLDMFLGPQYPFYSSVGLPDYMSTQRTKDYIPIAAFRAIYQDQHPFEKEGKNLLNMMIQKGKEMYYVSKVLPDVPEHVLFAYTKEQLEWCRKNEALVYNFFVSENMLYDNNWQKILRYVYDAPTSTGLPGSPGNIGTWIGYRMVHAYMEQQPKVTLKELVTDKANEQRFLQLSKYKPK